MVRIGIILVAVGVVYIIKPTIYQRWFWKKTDIMQQKLSLENYAKYMRISGVVLILIGMCV